MPGSLGAWTNSVLEQHRTHCAWTSGVPASPLGACETPGAQPTPRTLPPWGLVPQWREMRNGPDAQARGHQKWPVQVWEHVWARKSHFSEIISAHKSQIQKNHSSRLMCSRWKCLQFWFSFILVSENYMKSRTFHSNPLEPLSPVSKNYLLALF